MTSDGQLLRHYLDAHAEDAFAELVRRHLDLVYSAALRQVNGDAHLAQDVAQTVFTDLARKADLLSERLDLTGWLYTSTHFAAAKAVRTERRRHAHEQEAQLMHDLLHDSAPDLNWEKLSPVLDAAMLEIDEPDREAVLLRYFENRPHAEIATRLGLSENAARMRVDRALEKLRRRLLRRGITTATAALSVVIAANAVQAAPVGLAVIISAAATLTAGTALTTTGVLTASKAITMTALQKTLIAATTALLAGVGIYEAHHTAQLRGQLQTLRQQHVALVQQIQQLQDDRDDATNRLAGLMAETSSLQSHTDQTELLKLRGEVGVLRRQLLSQTEKAAEQPAIESALIKSIVYFGDDDQVKRWQVLGTRGIRILLQALQSSEYAHPTRMCVASLISQLGQDAQIAIPDLISFLKTEKDNGVRGLLLAYFEGQMDGLTADQKSEMLPELIHALENRDSSVRNNALVLLQSYGTQSETVLPLMVKAAQDSNPQVRLMAVKGLEQLDPQNSVGVDRVSVLAGCVTGPPGDSSGAANEAVILLGKLHRDPDIAVPALIQALRSNDRYVRQNAAVALGQFHEQASPALVSLEKALEDPDDGVRSRAAAAIAKIRSSTATER